MVDQQKVLQFKAGLKLDMFVQFGNRLENWLDSELASLRHQIPETLLVGSEDGLGNCGDWISDEIYLHDDAFRSAGRNALYMVVMAFAEQHMNGLCNEIQRHIKDSKEVKNIRSKSLCEACKYLEHTIGTLPSCESKSWELLRAHIVIRNSIAHAGKLKEYEAILVKLLETNGVILINELSLDRFCFEIKDGAIKQLASTIRDFLKLIHKDVSAKLKS